MLVLAGIGGTAGGVQAQATYDYMNQWYRFNQNYIKLYVSEDGTYRVSQTDLANAQVNDPSSIDPDKIQVFYRGKEVPIYVSSNGNQLDFFEFHGQRNDGGLDSLMYRSTASPYRSDPTQQPSTFFSFFTDTSAYFVTWDSLGLARQDPIQPTNYSAYTPEPWYRYRAFVEFTGTYFKGGGGATEVAHILNPDYVTGEGFVSGPYQTGDIADAQAVWIPTPGHAGSGNPTKVASRVLSSTTNAQHITAVDLYGTDVHFDTTAGINIKTIEFNYNAPLQSQTLVRMKAYGVGSKPDKQHAAWNYLEYDRNFDLNGEASVMIREFDEQDTTYLRFYNADVGSQAWIYDPANRLRIEATPRSPRVDSWNELGAHPTT
ncbi:MAG: hypothetical protein AAF570_27300, partial [Bacteroidota bacterium]